MRSGGLAAAVRARAQARNCRLMGATFSQGSEAAEGLAATVESRDDLEPGLPPCLARAVLLRGCEGRQIASGRALCESGAAGYNAAGVHLGRRSTWRGESDDRPCSACTPSGGGRATLMLHITFPSTFRPAEQRWPPRSSPAAAAEQPAAARPCRAAGRR